ncbi:MAG: IS1595 family transposase [Acidobacteria bacterium]|nr:IS1595 family transposase [Acidobacteriota bacterium]
MALHFSDGEEAYKLIESIRWPDGPICPHCGHDGKHYFLNPKGGTRKTTRGTISKRRVWKCSACRKQFSVLVGTIFHGTHIPLPKWLLAIHLISAGKNGVSAHELHRQLGITYKTAWFLAHRIRYAMARSPLAERLTGTIEADETYIGGKGKRRGRPGADSPKTPVVSLVQRDGEVRSTVVANVTGATLGQLLKENVDPTATLMTDEFAAYKQPGKGFAAHQTVTHKKGEYARGNVTTNRVEGYFSQLKRSIDGTHHRVSREHLHRYLSEFDYRYSTRKISDGARTVRMIRQSEGKRLKYADPRAEN